MENYTIGCTWFLYSKDGRFLMILRDDKLGIPYPGTWVFPGGTTEGEESPDDACLRELYEEFRYIPSLIQKFFVLYYPNRKAEEHFYWVPLNCGLKELTLGEGQKMELFTLDEIEQLELGFWCREIIPILRRFLEKLK